MKAILGLMMISILALTLNAQGDSKDAKKLAKEQEKAAKRAVEQAKRDMTVDFVQLIKFPMQYLNRPALRLERVAITDIQPYRDGADTYYPIALSKETESTRAFPLSDRLTFISDITMAQQLVQHIQGMRSGGIWPADFNPVADVYFQVLQGDLPNGQRYYIARVDCVGVYGFMSKLTNYGKCD